MTSRVLNEVFFGGFFFLIFVRTGRAAHRLAIGTDGIRAAAGTSETFVAENDADGHDQHRETDEGHRSNEYRHNTRILHRFLEPAQPIGDGSGAQRPVFPGL